MAKKKITQLDPATSVNSDAVFPFSQEDNNEDKTFKGKIKQLGDYINKSQDYSELNTTSKKVIGAINEVLANSDKDIISSIDTPAPIMTFNDGGDNIPVNKLLVAVTAQQASGTPTPSSPLAITGWSQAQITRTGKNLCPYLEQGQLSTTTGEEVASDTVRRSGFIRIEAGQTYAFSNLSTSSTQTNKRLRVFYYDRWKTYISNETTDLYDTTVNVTIPSGVGYIRFQASGTVLTETNAQVEKGSTPTTYEAYKGITVVIPFGDTYYGGILDVTNGKLTVTHKIWQASGATAYGNVGTSHYAYDANNKPDGMTQQDFLEVICDKYQCATSSEERLNGYCYTTSSGNIVFIDDRFTSLANAQSILSSEAPKIVYPLATPVVINLTPVQIATLSGLNNIYADCGDIQLLEYFNENADEIAELNRAMSDDFHIYSTAEQIVGKWIDGSDLYEKTFTANNVSSSGSQLIAHGINAGIMFVESAYAQYTQANTKFWATTSSYYSNVQNEEFKIVLSETSIIYKVGSYINGGSVAITIRYTKAS